MLLQLKGRLWWDCGMWLIIPWQFPFLLMFNQTWKIGQNWVYCCWTISMTKFCDLVVPGHIWFWNSFTEERAALLLEGVKLFLWKWVKILKTRFYFAQKRDRRPTYSSRRNSFLLRRSSWDKLRVHCAPSTQLSCLAFACSDSERVLTWYIWY